MKRFSAALLVLGLGTATLFTQLPVRAAEKTADTAANTAVQTADPSIVTTNGIQGWPQASDISSTAAIVMEILHQYSSLFQERRSGLISCQCSKGYDLSDGSGEFQSG